MSYLLNTYDFDWNSLLYQEGTTLV